MCSNGYGNSNGIDDVRRELCEHTVCESRWLSNTACPPHSLAHNIIPFALLRFHEMFSATQRLQFERTATRPTPNTYIHAHVACIYFHSSIFPFFLCSKRLAVLRCVASLSDMLLLLLVRCHCSNSNNRHENENEEFQSNTARAHFSLSLIHPILLFALSRSPKLPLFALSYRFYCCFCCCCCSGCASACFSLNFALFCFFAHTGRRLIENVCGGVKTYENVSSPNFCEYL